MRFFCETDEFGAVENLPTSGHQMALHLRRPHPALERDKGSPLSIAVL
jgi:hypothetical protein